jgi:hypothetical protein
MEEDADEDESIREQQQQQRRRPVFFHGNTMMQELWHIIELYVGLDEKNEDDDNKSTTSMSTTIVHKLLELPTLCPPLLVMLACRLYPYSLKQQDSEGNTPLHVALKNKKTTATATTTNQTWLIQYLLQLEPSSTRIANHEGQLPFCIARRSYEKWNHQVHSTLLQKYPSAIHKADTIPPSIYPNIFERILSGGGTSSSAAVAVETKHNDDNTMNMVTSTAAASTATATTDMSCPTTTIFEILRSAPLLPS